MILLSGDAVLDVERLRTFIESKNPDAAKRALATIWTALERVEQFPKLGMVTDAADIRQLVRYALLPDGKGILVTRMWHGREERS